MSGIIQEVYNHFSQLCHVSGELPSRKTESWQAKTDEYSFMLQSQGSLLKCQWQHLAVHFLFIAPATALPGVMHDSHFVSARNTIMHTDLYNY
jgi:nucleoid-associated protein YejK